MLNKLENVIGGSSNRDSFSGEGVRLHNEAEAERLVCNALALFELKEANLSVLLKGVDEKKAIVAFLKGRTHVSSKWIVTRRHAGHAANISRYMADVRVADPESRLSALVEMLKCEDCPLGAYRLNAPVDRNLKKILLELFCLNGYKFVVYMKRQTFLNLLRVYYDAERKRAGDALSDLAGGDDPSAYGFGVDDRGARHHGD